MNPRALSGLKLNCIILYVNLAIFMQPQCDVSELSEGGIMAGHISALTSTARHGLLLLTLNKGKAKPKAKKKKKAKAKAKGNGQGKG